MLHKRAPKVLQFRIADLPISPPREHDPRAIYLIQQEILGKIRVGLTRMPVSAIIRGFYKRVSGRTEHFTELEERAVSVVSRYIRGGARPSVEVYWSELAPNGGAFVCSDAEAVFEAYKRLGVLKIPVRVLRPKRRQTDDGSIWIGPTPDGVAIAKIVPARTLTSFEGRADANIPLDDLLGSLSAWSLEVAEAICNFHTDHPSSLNYHHMLNAIARRHSRFLDSVRLMISLGRLEHAALIARACYEAFLNFYVDWIAPEFIGPRLQLLAAMRVNGKNSDLRVLTNFTNLFENTKEKAKISSLGTSFYEAFYPPLSRMVHQSYIYVEREGSGFADTPDENDSVERIVLCLNVITVALLSRISNEIGKNL